MAKLKIGNIDLSITPQADVIESSQAVESVEVVKESAIDMSLYQEKILEVAAAVSKLNDAVSKMNKNHDERLSALSNTSHLISIKMEELENRKPEVVETVISTHSPISDEKLEAIALDISKCQDSIAHSHNYADSNHLEIVELVNKQRKLNKILIIGLVITTLLHLI